MEFFDSFFIDQALDSNIRFRISVSLNLTNSGIFSSSDYKVCFPANGITIRSCICAGNAALYPN